MPDIITVETFSFPENWGSTKGTTYVVATNKTRSFSFDRQQYATGFADGVSTVLDELGITDVTVTLEIVVHNYQDRQHVRERQVFG